MSERKEVVELIRIDCDICSEKNLHSYAQKTFEDGRKFHACISPCAHELEMRLIANPNYTTQKMEQTNLRERIEQAHMAGQADAGVDPSYSNARVYFEGLKYET